MNTMMKRYSFFIGYILVACMAWGRSVRLFTNERDLSNSLISDLYQDRKGYMWISTEDGLNRFDGAKMKVYRHVWGNEHSLPGSFVELVRQIRDGHLLVACNNGLAIYDYASDKFTRVLLDENVPGIYVRCILERADGSVLVGTSGHGLFVLHAGEPMKVEKLKTFKESNDIIDLWEDRCGDLWIVTENRGLYRMAADGKHTENYFGGDSDPLRYSFTCITEDGNGIIYVGNSVGGVFRYDRANNSFLHIPSDANCSVATMFVMKDNRILVGTDGNGLMHYDRERQRIVKIAIPAGTLQMELAKIHCLTQDYSGNLWVGVYQKGVVLWPERSRGFNYLGHTAQPHNVWLESYVTSLYKDREGNLWVGTDNEGVYRWNLENRTYTHFKHSDSDAHSVPATVLCIHQDADGTLWMGSYLDELFTIDPRTGQTKKAGELLPGKPQLYYKRVFAIAEDRFRRLWFATMGFGIWSLHMDTHEITHIDFEGEAIVNPSVDGLSNAWVYDLLVSSDDKLYIATTNGVACMDLKTGSFLTAFGENRICSGMIFYTLSEDSKGNIWMGSSSGLVRYEPKSRRMKMFTTEDGLPNDVICSIEEGNDNYIWVSTYYGLSRIGYDGSIAQNYYYNDGLQGNEFHFNASCKDVNGDLYFGGLNGVSYFTPTNILNERKTIDVRLTDFYIHGVPVSMDTRSGRYDVVDREVTEADRFELSFEDNSFTLEFSSFSFIEPSLITYVYSLDNEPWVPLKTGVNQVSFSNLNAGKHVFKVKAEGYNFSSDVRTYTIIVHEVWYLSGWAYLVYACLFLALVAFIFYYYRMRHIEAMKLKESELAKELNEAKLRFFINISHEVRTPLTLILSPLEKLMGMDHEPKRQEIYRMMHRNSNRILQLINQLMDIRKLDKGQMHLSFSETDMVGFLENLYELFQSTAETKHITFTFTHDMEKLPVWVDVQNFDKIIMNILTNAFKFTPDNGSIDITLQTGANEKDVTPLGHYFEIRVTDTGIGISDEEKDRIFERFYQIRDPKVNMNIGTGVGLNLTYSLVKLHHGSIDVEHNPSGQGSVFVVRLPLGCAHLKDSELETVCEETVVLQPHLSSETQDLVVDGVAKEEEKKRTKTKLRVMVVEDEYEVRRLIVSELSGDYKLMECANGEEAMEQLTRNAKQPDLIISDVMMPVMDGITFLDKLKHNMLFNHIPVILLTAKTRDEDRMAGLDTGADAYISKPFNIEVLKSTVKSLIRTREVLRNKYRGSQDQAGKLDKVELQSNDEKLLERIMKVINREIANPKLDVDLLTREVGISRVHLYRKLKELTNYTTSEFIRNLRLKQAAELLESKNLNITDVATAVGFSSLASFSVAFKSVYGMSPKDYMKSKRQDTEDDAGQPDK